MLSKIKKEMLSRTRWGGDFSLTLSISHKKEGSGQHEGVRQRSTPQDFFLPLIALDDDYAPLFSLL